MKPNNLILYLLSLRGWVKRGNAALKKVRPSRARSHGSKARVHGAALTVIGLNVDLGDSVAQGGEYPLVVRLAERLEDHLDAYLVDAREEPGPLVENVLDRGALLVDAPCELGDAARPVGQGYGVWGMG